MKNAGDEFSEIIPGHFYLTSFFLFSFNFKSIQKVVKIEIGCNYLDTIRAFLNRTKHDLPKQISFLYPCRQQKII